MPGFRYGPQDDTLLTPARADTGFLDYIGNLTYDNLYHMPLSSAYRWSNLQLAKGPEEGESDVLSPEEAKTKYGLDGELSFSEPIAESAAMLLHDRKVAELRREYLLANGSDDHWGRKLTGFGASLVTQALDPVNLAAMFIPVVGESRAFAGAAEAGFMSRGLISAKTLASVVGTDPLKYRLAKGALEGAVGTALVEPLIALPSHAEQAHYGWDDSAANIFFGSAMGAGLHGLGGLLHDKLGWFGGEVRRMDSQTHEAATMSAVSDLMKDETVTSPAEVINVDPHVVKQDLKFDAAEARKQALAELGIDKDPRVSREKLQPVKFDEEQFQKHVKELGDLTSKFLGDNLAPSEQHLDFQPVLSSKSDVPETYKPSETGIKTFRQIYKIINKAGYDLKGAKIEMGGESIVFITKDKAIKITSFETSDPANLVPGIVLHPELTKSLGELNIEVYPLAKIKGSDSPELTQAYELFGAKHGYIANDVHGNNIGEHNGQLFITDRGAITPSMDQKSPGYFQKLYENSNEETKRLYQQLEDQHELAKAQTSPQAIQTETEKRIRSLVEKKRREFKKQQVDESFVPDKEIKQKPEEITQEKISQADADLQNEITQLEKEMTEAFEKANPDKEVKSLTPKEDELIDKTKKISQAVQQGVECMIKKAL